MCGRRIVSAWVAVRTRLEAVQSAGLVGHLPTPRHDGHATNIGTLRSWLGRATRAPWRKPPTRPELNGGTDWGGSLVSAQLVSCSSIEADLHPRACCVVRAHNCKLSSRPPRQSRPDRLPASDGPGQSLPGHRRVTDGNAAVAAACWTALVEGREALDVFRRVDPTCAVLEGNQQPTQPDQPAERYPANHSHQAAPSAPGGVG